MAVVAGREPFFGDPGMRPCLPPSSSLDPDIPECRPLVRGRQPSMHWAWVSATGLAATCGAGVWWLARTARRYELLRCSSLAQGPPRRCAAKRCLFVPETADVQR